MRKLHHTLSMLAFILIFIAGSLIRADDEHKLAVQPPANTSAIISATAAEQDVIRLTNELRKNEGLGCLSINSTLSTSARLHSQDMANRDYFSHTALPPAPNGATSGDRATNAGYTGSTRGENIAAGYGTAANVHNGWINSSGHLANMLKTTANEIGVGYAYNSASEYGHYWTMVLGNSAGAGAPCHIQTYLPENISVGGDLTTYPVSPIFQWTHNTSTADPIYSNAEWYHLIVLKGNQVVMNEWVPVDNFNNIPASCSGSDCSYATSLNLQQGTYHLWMSGWSAAGNEQWISSPVAFDVDNGPSLVVLLSPEANATVTTATFPLRWQRDPKASWYHIQVSSSSGISFDQWYEDTEATGLCDETTCEINYTALVEGGHNWQMRSWGAAGFSPAYSNRNFTVDIVPPTAITGMTATPQLPYTQLLWTAQPGLAWYRVRITNPVTNAVAHDSWYAAADYCTTTCNIGDILLKNGSYNWQLLGWSPVNGGMMTDWYDISVVVNYPAPMTVNERTPGNTATVSSQVKLSWPEDDGAGWYHVYLSKPGTVVINQWYARADICNGTTCNLRGLNLPGGTYSWWMVAWGPAGYSQGGVQNSGYTQSTFTVSG